MICENCYYRRTCKEGIPKEDLCEDFLNFKEVSQKFDLKSKALGGLMFNYDAIVKFLNQIPLKQQP